MRTASVPGFLPSRNGFAFPNRWPAGPVMELQLPYLRVGLGEARDGLCGGMCLAVAARHARGDETPSTSTPPALGTALFHEIVRCQLDSLRLGAAPFAFWAAAARVARDAWSAGRQARQWRMILAVIAGGRPALVGLVRRDGFDPRVLPANHQVLAWSAAADGPRGRLRVYDPNHPGRDDVELTLVVDRGDARRVGVGGPNGRDGRPGVSLAQSTGEPLLALLHLPYRPAR